MGIWILPANRKMYNHELAFEELGTIDWRDINRKFNVGDIVYIYSTKPISSLQYKCLVIETKIPFSNKIDDTEFWEPKYVEQDPNRTYVRLKLLSKFNYEELHLDELKKQGLNAAPQGPSRLNYELVIYIEQVLNENMIIDDKEEAYFEGNQIKVLSTKYERNPKARELCLEYRGYSCVICNFNFEHVYGEIGKKFIHVHHIKPLYTINETYQVDPIKDLVPVCPNCHSMLHKKSNKNEFFTIEELKYKIISKD